VIDSTLVKFLDSLSKEKSKIKEQNANLRKFIVRSSLFIDKLRTINYEPVKFDFLFLNFDI